MGDDEWRWTDAWFFVSLVIASGAGRHQRSATSRRPEGVRLADVFSAADYLNRSLPIREDIEVAVRRLAGAGLINVFDGWFRLSEAGERLWRTRPPSGVVATIDIVRALLSRRHAPGGAEWSLTTAEHAAAVQEYHARAAALLPRHADDHRPG